MRGCVNLDSGPAVVTTLAPFQNTFSSLWVRDARHRSWRELADVGSDQIAP